MTTFGFEASSSSLKKRPRSSFACKRLEVIGADLALVHLIVFAVVRLTHNSNPIRIAIAAHRKHARQTRRLDAGKTANPIQYLPLDRNNLRILSDTWSSATPPASLQDGRAEKPGPHAAVCRSSYPATPLPLATPLPPPIPLPPDLPQTAAITFLRCRARHQSVPLGGVVNGTRRIGVSANSPAASTQIATANNTTREGSD